MKAASRKSTGEEEVSSRKGRRKRASDPFRFDRTLLDEDTRSGVDTPRGGLRLAGVDEAGRGCLAGPLVAAAVVFDYGRFSAADLKGLTDSKLLSSEKREALYGGIVRAASQISWVACSAATIDTAGLHVCNLRALTRALELLDDDYRFAVVDAFDLSRPDLRSRAIVGADFKSAAVAAASVVAKVTRDRLMRGMAALHPDYGFDEHVGYGTAGHRQALLQNGPCALHRLSFNGVGSQQLEFPGD